jgi:hypothetical protein
VSRRARRVPAVAQDLPYGHGEERLPRVGAVPLDVGIDDPVPEEVADLPRRVRPYALPCGAEPVDGRAIPGVQVRFGECPQVGLVGQGPGPLLPGVVEGVGRPEFVAPVQVRVPRCEAFGDDGAQGRARIRIAGAAPVEADVIQLVRQERADLPQRIRVRQPEDVEEHGAVGQAAGVCDAGTEDHVPVGACLQPGVALLPPGRVDDHPAEVRIERDEQARVRGEVAPGQHPGEGGLVADVSAPEPRERTIRHLRRERLMGGRIAGGALGGEDLALPYVMDADTAIHPEFHHGTVATDRSRHILECLCLGCGAENYRAETCRAGEPGQGAHRSSMIGVRARRAHPWTERRPGRLQHTAARGRRFSVFATSRAAPCHPGRATGAGRPARTAAPSGSAVA